MVATQSVEPIDLLIVDDEPDFLEPACRFFQRQGYRVVAAANAEQALAVQAKQHFHLAVIDQNMTGMLNMKEVDNATDPNYAQNNKHLRKLEEDAFKEGNMLFRDWADKRKNK